MANVIFPVCEQIQPRWQIRALDDPAAAAALSQDSREALRPGRIERKMTAKAEKIVAAASRLWGKFIGGAG